MNATRAAVFILLLASALPLYAHAQLQVADMFPSLSISLSPANPAPGQAVRLTLRGAQIDLSSAIILWTIPGMAPQEGMGLTSITTVAGPLGSDTPVEATAQNEEGIVGASAHIRPSRVVINWEADSYVPPLFRGRALPSAGSSVRAEASVSFMDGGAPVAPSSLTYTWRKNGLILASVSGKGKSSAIFPAPKLYASDTITVTVKNSDGTLSGQGEISIDSVESHLALYPNHPLFGVLWYEPLTKSTAVQDTQMNFFAVPYFSSAPSLSDKQLVYEWKVNGSPIATDASVPNRVAVVAPESGAEGTVSLSVSNTSNLFDSPEGEWHMVFSLGGASRSASSSRSSSDPFRPLPQ